MVYIPASWYPIVETSKQFMHAWETHERGSGNRNNTMQMAIGSMDNKLTWKNFVTTSTTIVKEAKELYSTSTTSNSSPCASRCGAGT